VAQSPPVLGWQRRVVEEAALRERERECMCAVVVVVGVIAGREAGGLYAGGMQADFGYTAAPSQRPAAPPVTTPLRNLALWDSDLATLKICSASSRVGAMTSARGRRGLLAIPPNSSSFRPWTVRQGRSGGRAQNGVARDR
jgi:hypothetical protein